ncbi:MAG: hypothetical protein Q8L98_07125 [Chlamydiales bacterium]|nr:hypothetical protein [Chlamydiales bacterium]
MVSFKDLNLQLTFSFKDLYLNPMERPSVTTVMTLETHLAQSCIAGMGTGALFSRNIAWRSSFDEDQRKVNFSEYVPVLTGVKRILMHIVYAITGADYKKCLGEIKRGFLEIIPLIGNVVMRRFDQERLRSFQKEAEEEVRQNPSGYLDVNYVSCTATFKDGKLIEKVVVEKCERFKEVESNHNEHKKNALGFFQENDVDD